MHALRIPSTSLTQSQAMQLDVERDGQSHLPQVAFVFSKTGTAEIASDPMPPNVSDTFIILKPQDAWPDPTLPKDELVEQIEQAAQRTARQQLRILPADPDALQRAVGRRARRCRGQGLRRRVRADAATRPTRWPAILRSTEGAADVKVEQASGLPVLEITIDKAAIARRGLNLTRRARCDRHRDRRPRSRRGVRGRPAFRDRRAAAGDRAQRS